MGDKVKRIGTRKSGTRKVDDLLIEVQEKHMEEPTRIVIEAKSGTQRIGGRKGLLRQLDDAMDLRKAQYSIGVGKEEDSLKGADGCFTHIHPDKVLCTYEPDGTALELAYRFARAEVLLRSMTRPLLASATRQAIVMKMAEIKTKLDGLRSAKAHLTQIESSTDTIRKIIGDLQEEVRSILMDMEEFLSTSSSPQKLKRVKKSAA